MAEHGATDEEVESIVEAVRREGRIERLHAWTGSAARPGTPAHADFADRLAADRAWIVTARAQLAAEEARAACSCTGGWLGDDEWGRPRPCPQCRPSAVRPSATYQAYKNPVDPSVWEQDFFGDPPPTKPDDPPALADEVWEAEIVEEAADVARPDVDDRSDGPDEQPDNDEPDEEPPVDAPEPATSPSSPTADPKPQRAVISSSRDATEAHAYLLKEHGPRSFEFITAAQEKLGDNANSAEVLILAAELARAAYPEHQPAHQE